MKTDKEDFVPQLFLVLEFDDSLPTDLRHPRHNVIGTNILASFINATLAQADLLALPAKHSGPLNHCFILVLVRDAHKAGEVIRNVLKDCGLLNNASLYYGDPAEDTYRSLLPNMGSILSQEEQKQCYDRIGKFVAQIKSEQAELYKKLSGQNPSDPGKAP